MALLRVFFLGMYFVVLIVLVAAVLSVASDILKRRSKQTNKR
jgi:hypothetical protein